MPAAQPDGHDEQRRALHCHREHGAGRVELLDPLDTAHLEIPAVEQGEHPEPGDPEEDDGRRGVRHDPERRLEAGPAIEEVLRHQGERRGHDERGCHHGDEDPYHGADPPGDEEGAEGVHRGADGQEGQRLLEAAGLCHVGEEAPRVAHHATPGVDEAGRGRRR